jgi:hypothetical protein
MKMYDVYAMNPHDRLNAHPWFRTGDIENEVQDIKNIQG